MKNWSDESGWKIHSLPDKRGIFRKWKTIAVAAGINARDNPNGVEIRWPCGLILRCSLEDVKSHKPCEFVTAAGKQIGVLFHNVPVKKFYLVAGDPTWLLEKGYVLKETTGITPITKEKEDVS